MAVPKIQRSDEEGRNGDQEAEEDANAAACHASVTGKQKQTFSGELEKKSLFGRHIIKRNDENDHNVTQPGKVNDGENKGIRWNWRAKRKRNIVPGTIVKAAP